MIELINLLQKIHYIYRVFYKHILITTHKAYVTYKSLCYKVVALVREVHIYEIYILWYL